MPPDRWLQVHGHTEPGAKLTRLVSSGRCSNLVRTVEIGYHTASLIIKSVSSVCSAGQRFGRLYFRERRHRRSESRPLIMGSIHCRVWCPSASVEELMFLLLSSGTDSSPQCGLRLVLMAPIELDSDQKEIIASMTVCRTLNVHYLYELIQQRKEKIMWTYGIWLLSQSASAIRNWLYLVQMFIRI